jgi:hypothetical protein
MYMKKIMQSSLLLVPLLAITLLSMRCRKNKNEPETPKTELEKLPPITQTGANTFGCLVNGVAWLPNGTKPNNGAPNVEVYVDPTFQGGAFYVTGHKYKDPEGFVSIGSGKCTGSGIFQIDNNSINSFNSFQYLNSSPFIFYSPPELNTYSKGYLNVTKYDLGNRIFSGIFECVLYNPQKSPDTIKITNGRFDVKL